MKKTIVPCTYVFSCATNKQLFPPSFQNVKYWVFVSCKKPSVENEFQKSL